MPLPPKMREKKVARTSKSIAGIIGTFAATIAVLSLAIGGASAGEGLDNLVTESNDRLDEGALAVDVEAPDARRRLADAALAACLNEAGFDARVDSPENGGGVVWSVVGRTDSEADDAYDRCHAGLVKDGLAFDASESAGSVAEDGD